MATLIKARCLQSPTSMGLLQILTEGLRITQEQGLRDAYRKGRTFTREAAIRRWHRLSGSVDRGKPIYESDWDLLVILDACRFDALQEVADDYGFVENVESRDSVGSYSLSWMKQNFTEDYADEMAKTAMITGNPFTETALDPEQFTHLEEVWRYSWDDEIGTIRPRPLTDRAISVARDDDPDRMIVHYMQPHEPFTTHPELQQGPSASDWAHATNKSIWMRVQEGDIPLDVAREAYYDELRMVLDDVEILLNNVDADTAVITADHGEAMGEYGIYGHARGVAIDALRVVPWAETTAVDAGEHNPAGSKSTETNGGQMERLHDLGYLQ